MRPLLKWTTAGALALSLTLGSNAAAAPQPLQWQHASQQTARAPRAAKPSRRPARTTTGTTTRAPALAVKQPVVRRPQAFKPPTGAQPLRPVPSTDSSTGTSAAKQAAQQASRLRTAKVSAARVPRTYPGRNASPVRSPRSQTPRNHRNGIGTASLVDEIVPAQWEGPIGAPACDCAGGACAGGGCAEGGCADSLYGEIGCGVPSFDPGCGFEEPGCGISYGQAGGCAEGCGDCYGEPTCGCGGSGCGDSVGPNGWENCGDRGCIPVLWLPPIHEIVVFGGVQGFKGPLDRTRDSGNFGFHEGFNVSGPMAWLAWPGLGYQIGYQAVHSQLNGDANSGTNSGQTQHFITAGLFRRKQAGLQYGVVWDMLRDDRQGAYDFGQVRGEIGFKNLCGREIGFAYTVNTNDNQLPTGNGLTTFQATDQYLLYYRLSGPKGGGFRAFAGLDGNASGLFGGDFHLPLNPRWSFEGGWTYLFPESGTQGSASRDEAWNLSMQMVWHYGSGARSRHLNPYRPLFNVADNGSLIVVD